ncbi:MAG TPA: sigma-70 family RNA polymerase sigma factor [Saprospiraceae bacterium]|nr:sigma-70 family RNA polymerase sigma factor [Saprospiraceae bacterium]
MTNELLWKSLKRGDKHALEIIYKNEVNHLYNYGIRFTQDRHLILDAIHDTFEEIWKRRKNLSPEVSIRPYLMTSVRRRIVVLIQKNSAGPRMDTFFLNLEDNQQNVEKQWIDFENQSLNQNKLEKALRVLSTRQKEAVYLKFYENLSYEEIGNIMGIHYQSIRNLVTQALKKMKDEWK